MLIQFEDKFAGMLDYPCIYEGYFLLRAEDDPVLEHGDVICFNNAEPNHIHNTSTHDPEGFVIQGMAGTTLMQVFNLLSHYNEHSSKYVSFWRLLGNEPRGKKPYVPSNWATPVPLP